MRRGHAIGVLAAAAAGLAVAGCGVSTPATPSAAQAAEQLAPRQLVAQASKSLSRMRSLQVVISGKSARHPRFTIAVAVQLPGRLSMSIRQGRGSMAVRLIRGRSYFRASQQFWADLAPTAKVAPRLANRWIGQQAKANPGAVALEKWTRGRTLLRCLAVGVGKTGALSYAGTSQVDGISTVVVRDHGNRPGTTPNLMYISAAAPHLLLRDVQTGPARRGGAANANCQLSSPGLRSVAGATAAASLFQLTASRVTATISGYDSTSIDSPPGVRPADPQSTSTAQPASLTPAIVPPAGFTSGTTQAPRTGTWDATGTTTASVGYADDSAGSTLQRVWTITRSCTQRCTYTLIRPVVDNGIASIAHTTLVHEAEGWRATWPAQRFTCGGTSTDPIYWNQQEVWVLRFSRHGSVAQAKESRFSFTPACGYGRASVTWLAKFTNPSTETNNSLTS